MFNFVKLERRIKFKGFDDILYGTTAVQLRTVPAAGSIWDGIPGIPAAGDRDPTQ